jgi:hypothetical protein
VDAGHVAHVKGLVGQGEQVTLSHETRRTLESALDRRHEGVSLDTRMLGSIGKGAAHDVG